MLDLILCLILVQDRVPNFSEQWDIDAGQTREFHAKLKERSEVDQSNLTEKQHARLVWLEQILRDPDVGHFYNATQRAAMREELEHWKLLQSGTVSALRPDNL